MTFKKVAFINVGMSILCALVVLAVSKRMEGSEHAGTVTIILIGIWFIPFAILSVAANKARKRESR